MSNLTDEFADILDYLEFSGYRMNRLPRIMASFVYKNDKKVGEFWFRSECWSCDDQLRKELDWEGTLQEIGIPDSHIA